jgi:putative nucleotidyltransferase with HDIG domain
MKTNILLVDDEPRVLQALQRMLHFKHQEWNLEFADSSPRALALMAKMSFRIVVSDLLMPGMDGVQFLEEVRRLYPQTARLIFCWRAERQSLPRAFGTAHQFLFKPCEPAVLVQTLTRLLDQTELLSDPRLKSLVSQMRFLPSLPEFYVELMREMQTENASIEHISQIIGRDPGISAKILQLVNSAFFGVPRHVSTPDEAVMFLGLETVKAIVLSLHLFASFDRAKVKAFDLRKLWQHSWSASLLAKKVCLAGSRDLKKAEQAFTAGLLHDIGKLVLAANLPDSFQQALAMARNPSVSLLEAERATFGATHAEVGAYLLALWGIPQPVVEAVAFHHTPAQCLNGGFSALTAVHLANALAHAQIDGQFATWQTQVDQAYLCAVGCEHQLVAWQELTRMITEAAPENATEPAVF